MHASGEGAQAPARISFRQMARVLMAGDLSDGARVQLRPGHKAESPCELESRRVSDLADMETVADAPADDVDELANSLLGQLLDEPARTAVSAMLW